MKVNAIEKGLAVAAVVAASCWTCQALARQGSSSSIASRGVLSGTLTTRGMVTKGDTFVGTSSIDLISDNAFTLRFAGFSNPVGAGGSPFAMKLRFDVTGMGTVFDGDAAFVNGSVVTVPVGLAKAGVSLTMTRSIAATGNVLAGSYSDSGVVAISQM